MTLQGDIWEGSLGLSYEMGLEGRGRMYPVNVGELC